MSVVTMLVLVALVAWFLRPMLRNVALREVVAGANVGLCESTPATWERGSGDFGMYAYSLDGVSENPHAPTLETDLLARARDTDQLVIEEPSIGNSVGVVRVRDSGPCAVLRVHMGNPGARVLWNGFAALIGATAMGMLLAGFGTWWFVVVPLRRQVEDLSSAARGVGEDGFQHPEASPDALGDIATVLSQSHERIVETRKALEQRNKALEEHFAGIAHDLRTPLASAQLALEVIADEAGHALREESTRALTDVVYLSALVENLHQGTRLRHGTADTSGAVDLAVLVRRLEQRFQILGRHNGVDVGASVPELAVWARCAPALAERAIANLVHNAVEHNNAGGHVAITLTVEGDGFCLVVADDGPGRPEGLGASIEESTFLLEPERPRGPGLGMVITAEIARQSGWTVRYEAGEPRGIRAIVEGVRQPP